MQIQTLDPISNFFKAFELSFRHIQEGPYYESKYTERTSSETSQNIADALKAIIELQSFASIPNNTYFSKNQIPHLEKSLNYLSMLQKSRIHSTNWKDAVKELGQSAGYVTEAAIQQFLATPEGRNFVTTNLLNPELTAFISTKSGPSSPHGIRAEVIVDHPGRQKIFVKGNQPLADIILQDAEAHIYFNIVGISSKRTGTPADGINMIDSSFGKLTSSIFKRYQNRIPFLFYRVASVKDGLDAALKDTITTLAFNDIMFSEGDDFSPLICVNYLLMNTADYIEYIQSFHWGIKGSEGKFLRSPSTTLKDLNEESVFLRPMLDETLDALDAIRIKVSAKIFWDALRLKAVGPAR